MNEHWIGTTISQEIEFQDANGDTIPASGIELVRVSVLVNNIVKQVFVTGTPGQGEEQLVEDDDLYTYIVTGEMQADWTPGLIEVEIYRQLADDAGEITERYAYAMARATATQSTLSA